jgi:type I restriction enzyme S subunit
MNEWKTYRLDDVVSISSGGTPSKSKKEYWGGDIPWISASSMNGYYYSDSDLKVTNDGVKNGARMAPKNSLLLLVRGSILHQKIQVGITTRELTFNQDVKCLVAKDSIVEPLYLLFWFKAIESQLLAKVESTGIGAGKIDTSILKNLEIHIPPKNERGWLINVFLKITDKIELNRQMNQTLEAMAQALFKSWFVDFDPVLDNALESGYEIPEALQAMSEKRQLVPNSKKLLHTNPALAAQFPSNFVFNEVLDKWIPEGWGNIQVENLLNRLKINKKYKKDQVKEFGEIPVYEQGAGILLGYHDGVADIQASIENQAFIFGDHTCVMKLGITPFSISANVIVLKGKLRNTLWTYFGLKGVQSFEEYRRHWMELAVKNIILPKHEICDSFEQLIKPLIVRLHEYQKEIETLTQLRDTLLPELISGRVRVPGVGIKNN